MCPSVFTLPIVPIPLILTLCLGIAVIYLVMRLDTNYKCALWCVNVNCIYNTNIYFVTVYRSYISFHYIEYKLLVCTLVYQLPIVYIQVILTLCLNIEVIYTAMVLDETIGVPFGVPIVNCIYTTNIDFGTVIEDLYLEVVLDKNCWCFLLCANCKLCPYH